MGRIEKAFAAEKRPAFISFVVAGDPDKGTSIRIARALIAGGTDILELGVPFSDPVADGPTIQKADERRSFHRGKGLLDPSHQDLPVMAATSATSLSPRPERLMITMSSRSNLSAFCIT